MGGLNLDAEQLERYSRHIIMDDVGPPGQRRLLDARVLLIGAGGLGAPVVQYLSAAGVGTLGIADDDEVELSNLHRQVLHGTDDVGRPKVESAADFVRGLNPDVDLELHPIRVASDNVNELLSSYDFVVDATDNFQTRYLVNDACTLANLPYSHGAIYRFEGQVTTFAARGDSPCYRCLFPEAPPAGTIPDCATAGVLGVLPGTIGAIQATEAVKFILGTGELLDGRLVYYDALGLSFDEVPIQRNPDCPVCGDSPAIDSVRDVDYVESCAIAAD